MSVVRSQHEGLNAVFATVGGRELPLHYGKPARAHRAVRKVVGVTEMAYGVVVVAGDDRVDFVDNAVSNRVPREDGRGVYALLLDPQGAIRTDLFVYNAGERLLLFTPPDQAADLAADWREKTFIQDVEVRVATDEFGVFGVHGPKATEKIASVLNGAAAPDGRFAFERGRMRDRGVTVVRTDNPAGEESYEVVCAAADADEVFDALLNHGNLAAPFGTATWDTLTLEAGTPLFPSELAGVLPNALGLRSALDFEKGCYVGQEVVSRVENRGRPDRRLVGLLPETVPESGATVRAGDEAVGAVTRAAESPTREEPIALALVDFTLDQDADLTVRVDGEEVPAETTSLPFVEGGERSGRLPDY
ncbi:aminomethyltransferase family protein [Halobacteriaceae archaeon GCM10025711]